MHTVQCPHCNANIRHDDSHAGQVVSCPHCRGQLQLPRPPQVACGNAIFEDIGEESYTRPRRRQQPSYAGLWSLALLFLMGIGITGLWLSGVIQFKSSQKGADGQTKDAGANKDTVKHQPESDRPQFQPKTVTDPKVSKDQGEKGHRGTLVDAEAREQLKGYLDSWIFGDSLEKYKKDHAGVTCIDVPHALYELKQHKIVRYEVVSSRKSKTDFEYAVDLIFQNSAGVELSESRKYIVKKTGSKNYDIFGFKRN